MKEMSILSLLVYFIFQANVVFAQSETPIPTLSPTPTIESPSVTPTNLPEPSSTPSPTLTPTNVPTISATNTPKPTAVPTRKGPSPTSIESMPKATSTSIPTPTIEQSPTPTPTQTLKGISSSPIAFILAILGIGFLVVGYFILMKNKKYTS